MMYYPTLTPENVSRDYIDVFGGYNHNYRINDNEFYDMKNMSSDCYPLLATRAPRGVLPESLALTLTNVRGMLYRSDFYHVTHSLTRVHDNLFTLTLYKNGTPIYTEENNFTFDTTVQSGPTRELVMMGAYLIIMPDKVYINTADYSDFGRINATAQTVVTGNDPDVVTVQQCFSDGSPINIDYIGEEVPNSPGENFIWLDISTDPPILKRYYSANSMWTVESSYYLKITVSNNSFASDFKEGDGVKISGIPEISDNAAPIIHKIERGENQTSIVINALCEFDPNLTSYISSQTATVTGSVTLYCDNTYTENDSRLKDKTFVIGNATANCTGNSALRTSYKKIVDTEHDLTDAHNTVTSVGRNQTGIYAIEVVLEGNESFNSYPNGIDVRQGDKQYSDIYKVTPSVSSTNYAFLTVDRTTHNTPVSVAANTVFYPMTDDTDHPEYYVTAYFDKSFTIEKGQKIYYSLAYTRSQTDQITISRTMPTLDFIIESQNRLWGCRYGENNNGDIVNEIYASKLGDFKNWQCFEGISSDSYVASCGTDGEWTGAVNYLGKPIFLKENYIHTVYGSYPSQYQINSIVARGVHKGSGKSIAMINETLYYLSDRGVMLYNGSLPTEISSAFGIDKYHNGVACGYNNKYYLCAKDSANKNVMFVYDTKRGIWNKEDDLYSTVLCAVSDDVYYIKAAGGVENVKSLFGSGGKSADPVQWYVESGIFGLSQPDSKYISRLNLRLSLDYESNLIIYIQYDSQGGWIELCNITRPNIRPFTLPIKPRRCDHFRLRLEGSGGIKLYSIAKTIEQGSDKL